MFTTTHIELCLGLSWSRLFQHNETNNLDRVVTSHGHGIMNIQVQHIHMYQGQSKLHLLINTIKFENTMNPQKR